MLLQEEEKDGFVIISSNEKNEDLTDELSELKVNEDLINEYVFQKKDSSQRSFTDLRSSSILIEKNDLFEKIYMSIDVMNDINKNFVEIMMREQFLQSEMQKMTKISEVLKVLRSQYSFILKVFFSDYDVRSEENYVINIRSKEDFNFPIMEKAIDFILFNLLLEIFLSGQKLTKSISQKNKIMNELEIHLAKLQATIEYFPPSVIFDKNDLFSLPLSHSRWNELHSISNIINLNSIEIINNSFKNFVKSINLASAMMSAVKDKSNKSQLYQGLYTGYSAIYYWFLDKEARNKAQLFYANPHSATAIKVWNLPDTGLIKKMIKISLPTINYHKKIYIDKQYSEINLENINEASEPHVSKIISLKDNNNYIYSSSIKRFWEKISNKFDKKIRIRILSNFSLQDPLFYDQKVEENSFINEIFKNSIISWFFSKEIRKTKRCDNTILIHIHGGGFISMSSGSHQNYTRIWANKLEIPVFSIDYRLAPEFPYPNGLDDCWQAYNWIIDNVESIFKIKPNKVILAGDSAGGNLVLAITLKAITKGKKIPSGLLLAYPALNLDPTSFTPSLLLAINDQIVPYSFLKMCLQLYMKDEECNPKKDPYLSPILLSEEILKFFPPTRILFGTQDPLHDDCWRFAEKLMKANVNVRLSVFNGMPHGFLNYDFPKGMREAKKCINHGAKLIEELINLSL